MCIVLIVWCELTKRGGAVAKWPSFLFPQGPFFLYLLNTIITWIPHIIIKNPLKRKLLWSKSVEFPRAVLRKFDSMKKASAQNFNHIVPVQWFTWPRQIAIHDVVFSWNYSTLVTECRRPPKILKNSQQYMHSGEGKSVLGQLWGRKESGEIAQKQEYKLQMFGCALSKACWSRKLSWTYKCSNKQ